MQVDLTQSEREFLLDRLRDEEVSLQRGRQNITDAEDAVVVEQSLVTIANIRRKLRPGMRG